MLIDLSYRELIAASCGHGHRDNNQAKYRYRTAGITNTGMTMKTSLKIAVLLLGLSAFTAHAEMDQYVGVNVSRAQYKENGFPTASPTAISVKLGGQLSPNFAFETRVGKGVADGNITSGGIPLSL